MLGVCVMSTCLKTELKKKKSLKEVNMEGEAYIS